MSIPTQISIPKPCSEDWNAMVPHQRFKHCQSCNKSVYTLEEYDTKEATELLRRPSSVCVRAAYNKNGQVRLRTGFSSVLLLGGLLACGRADEGEIQGEVEPYPAIEVSESALHIQPGEVVQVGVPETISTGTVEVRQPVEPVIMGKMRIVPNNIKHEDVDETPVGSNNAQKSTQQPAGHTE